MSYNYSVDDLTGTRRTHETSLDFLMSQPDKSIFSAAFGNAIRTGLTDVVIQADKRLMRGLFGLERDVSVEEAKKDFGVDIDRPRSLTFVESKARIRIMSEALSQRVFLETGDDMKFWSTGTLGFLAGSLLDPVSLVASIGVANFTLKAVRSAPKLYSHIMKGNLLQRGLKTGAVVAPLEAGLNVGLDTGLTLHREGRFLDEKEAATSAALGAVLGSVLTYPAIRGPKTPRASKPKPADLKPPPDIAEVPPGIIPPIIKNIDATMEGALREMDKTPQGQNLEKFYAQVQQAGMNDSAALELFAKTDVGALIKSPDMLKDLKRHLDDFHANHHNIPTLPSKFERPLRNYSEFLEALQPTPQFREIELRSRGLLGPLEIRKKIEADFKTPKIDIAKATKDLKLIGFDEERGILKYLGGESKMKTIDIMPGKVNLKKGKGGLDLVDEDTTLEDFVFKNKAQVRKYLGVLDKDDRIIAGLIRGKAKDLIPGAKDKRWTDLSDAEKLQGLYGLEDKVERALAKEVIDKTPELQEAQKAAKKPKPKPVAKATPKPKPKPKPKPVTKVTPKPKPKPKPKPVTKATPKPKPKPKPKPVAKATAKSGPPPASIDVKKDSRLDITLKNYMASHYVDKHKKTKEGLRKLVKEAIEKNEDRLPADEGAEKYLKGILKELK